MKFNNIEETMPKEKTPPFVKLQADQSITGVFRGDIYEFKTHRVANADGKELPVFCPSTGCTHCASRVYATFRFRLNFVYRDGGEFLPIVFEQGKKVYAQLAEINSSNPLEKSVIKITRKGEGLDTAYEFEFKRPLEDDAAKMIANVPLFDLSFGHKRLATALAALDTSDDLPF